MSIINTARKIKKSIVIAARNKAAAQRPDYRVKPLEVVPGAYYVKNVKGDVVYIVDTVFQSCTCPAFEADGYCKHYCMVQNDRREDAELAAREEEMQYALADVEEGS